MNSRRTVIIAAALALAALAFVGNVWYLNGAQQRANDNAQLVKVFVVKKDIPKGLTGDQAISQDYVKAGEIPQQFYPGTAIRDINDIKNKVAINALPPGALVLNGQFVDANVAQVTTAQQVDPGNVAITISVDQVHGVAGLLLPGDKVDMIVTGQEPNNTNQSSAQVMYQNVKILAIGTKTAPQVGDTSAKDTKAAAAETASGLITFAVPLDAAQRIALAASNASGNSSIYLTLVPPDNAPVNPVPGRITSGDLFKDLSVTPYPDGK